MLLIIIIFACFHPISNLKAPQINSNQPCSIITMQIDKFLTPQLMSGIPYFLHYSLTWSSIVQQHSC